MTGLDAWNGLPTEEAAVAVLPCTGSSRWARLVAAGRPYADEAELFDAARQTWRGLGDADWLEAFASHPRIGERPAEHASAQAKAWSAEEQAAATPDEAIAARLAEDNRRYEARFGHVLLVCATGRSALELLGELEARLGNPPEAEILVAAAEGEKIMEIRLRKWLEA